MLYEILTTSSMGAIVLSTYFLQNKKSSNDHEKIKMIANAAGLKTKEEGIRIRRRNRNKNHTEYVYQMPLGLSYKQFKAEKDAFVDGLNNKSTLDIQWSKFKGLDWKGDIIKQMRNILTHRKKLDKHLEIEYDGMLRFRVYDEGLRNKYQYSDDILQKGWTVPIGYSFKELLTHDFEKRPHMIIAGTTGFGKSEYIKLLISTLIKQQPNNLRLHLIDLKGGSELGVFKDLYQTVNFGRTIKETKKILEDAQADMEYKSNLQFEKGVNNVNKSGQKERHFVIIDEAATLDNDCKEIVTDIARRGRSAGYRLVYATQYPTNETLPSQVRANIGVRLCYRLETNAQSRAVLDEGGAEELPEIEGRAIFRRVKNHIVQTPLIDDRQIDDVVGPHINIKGDVDAESKGRRNTFKFEEI